MTRCYSERILSTIMRLKRPAFALLLLATLSAALIGQEADRASTEALSQRAAERLRALHDEADRLAGEARTVLGDLRRLEVERQIRSEELGNAQRNLASVSARIEELDDQIADLEAQSNADAPALRARLINLYKLGGGRYTRLLLSTSDVQHLAEASRLVSAMASQDRDRAAAHQKRIDDLIASRAALEQQRARMTVLGAEAARARAATEAALQARNALIKEIDERRDLNAQLSGELLAAQLRLQTTLADLTAGASAPGANAAAGAPAASGTAPPEAPPPGTPPPGAGSAGGTPTAAPPSASPVTLPIGPFRGDLEWPVEGALRQRFGASLQGRAAPSNGIDIAANEGAAVTAVHDGTVVFADTFIGFGRLVIVDHGAQAFSLYGNLQDMAVQKGARVKRGGAIGSVGVAANGAAGLYFELRVDGRPVDPVQWLRKK
jgi:septal ring factor EnvC (AmiA/AmiB activator)